MNSFTDNCRSLMHSLRLTLTSTNERFVTNGDSEPSASLSEFSFSKSQATTIHICEPQWYAQLVRLRRASWYGWYPSKFYSTWDFLLRRSDCGLRTTQ